MHAERRRERASLSKEYRRQKQAVLQRYRFHLDASDVYVAIAGIIGQFNRRGVGSIALNSGPWLDHTIDGLQANMHELSSRQRKRARSYVATIATLGWLLMDAGIVDNEFRSAFGDFLTTKSNGERA